MSCFYYLASESRKLDCNDVTVFKSPANRAWIKAMFFLLRRKFSTCLQLRANPSNTPYRLDSSLDAGAERSGVMDFRRPWQIADWLPEVLSSVALQTRLNPSIQITSRKKKKKKTFKLPSESLAQ